MPDSGFDIEGLLTQAVQGKLSDPTPPAVPQNAPQVTLPDWALGGAGVAGQAPSSSNDPGRVDVEGALKQASEGNLKYTPPPGGGTITF